MKNIIVICFLFFCNPFIVRAQLKFAKIFSDNMVLQRGQEINIWGIGTPGSIIKVIKNKTSKLVKTQTDSTWNVKFPKENANKNPQTIIAFDEKDTIKIQNVLIGDVWLCIGQSNMEWPMSKEIHFQDELQFVNNSLLRWYNPNYVGKNIYNSKFSDSILSKLNFKNFYSGFWEESNDNTIRKMSAVSYFFGKRISNELNIPVGLINLSIGGAPLETFISVESLKSSKQFSNKIIGNWLMNNSLPKWTRERGKQNLSDFKSENNHGYKPGFAFESGIKPFINFSIKGIINYQGESNAQEQERVLEYANLTELMIKDYRKKWHQPNMPYYFVQISSIDLTNYKSALWPQFRNEQRKIIKKLHHSGMVVSSDVGLKDDIHPTDKKIIGQRLANLALNKTYKLDIPCNGPIPLVALYSKNRVKINFSQTYKGLQASNDSIVHGFSIDGIHEIEASIKMNNIIIKCNKKPQFVYYGWQPYSMGNLINSEHLPVSTFKISIK